ncbi:MAG: pyrimidine-nucleoside phosphorylase [Lachnospiraceae bacterium]|uniref:pyrimidine-nucleoside phosphorylase n=1 Tax=Falcatimonas sp. MSJ-15 TaxID=2841515 RepID=UPI001C11ABE8|nr:pyrimidine-nucleoside phosphorylase [Falcatimonas sp. MSJ-15]MBQ5734450.1 pyrimidine-nucleoside phosphorylase [Lachnospiraceae bacterium]MBU5469531.1 pyrimidine-nucleoside phosphorylase [Falcatimonas sp. MSJ-15]MEE0960339.1 pyrimidine-nucleoside phosphorylase [Lachnospiraceae bacterium]
MRMYDLIMKKRNGGELSTEEINQMIIEYTKGNIPDYQMSAFLMAVFFVGMSEKETIALTMAMANSGEMVDLSAIHGLKADKHSTGGVGDKTSLVLGPMVASLGIPVAKMSGRGLGHTGGTIDKLESFDGFSTSLTTEQFINNVNNIKMAIIGQTGELAPADKKLYALRDVTATVDNISLIASSIMSKKIAAGADTIVLDVKCGSGAFMKTEEDAVKLGTEMVKIGRGIGRETYAIVSDMDQPLGYAVGNALEVKEAIDTLNGNGPKDLLELCLTLGSYMLIGTKKASDADEARAMLKDTITSKKALNKFAEFVKAQGGDERAVYDTSLLPKASLTQDCYAASEGYISSIHSDEVGMVSLTLGGGRETKESKIDLSVGVVLKKKVGDYVKKGDVIATLYANSEEKLKAAKERFDKTYSYSDNEVKKPVFIKRIIDN